jgi:hypothetical protein
MTAEIAVLNKLAVTLAADSAVTIGTGDTTKVYNSADKIFEGTNHDPIGVMVYNNPEISDIPVESIVKMYRDRQCQTSFSTVFDYAEAFLRHLEALDSPPITAVRTINSLASGTVYAIKRLLEENTNEFWTRLRDDPAAAPSGGDLLLELQAEQHLVLDTFASMLESAEDQDWTKGLTEREVIDQHGSVLEDLVTLAFDDVFLAEGASEKIVRAAALAILKDYDQSVLTGLVFAGFGADEIFPSLISYEVYGVVAGRLKYRFDRRFDVDRKLEPDAAILPFAQQEMVDRFMYGLDNEFLDLCNRFFAGSLTALKVKLSDALEGADDAIRDAISPAIDAILDEFSSSVVADHLTRSRAQLSNMVRSMPKQELAALCESLVHITSLKRKFSSDAESVGGPIDVAMITRAEGFVWVKRKHYFDPVLNPRYFARRYAGSDTAAPTMLSSTS